MPASASQTRTIGVRNGRSPLVTRIAGAGRGWHSPALSVALKANARSGITTPTVVLDDLDRMPTGTFHGSSGSVLLGLVKRATARDYFDPLLCVGYDVSAANWIVTANSPDQLDPALRDRLVVVPLAPPIRPPVPSPA